VRDGEQDTGAGTRLLLLAWVSLLVILVAAPEVYDQALRLPDDGRVAEIAFLAALSGFIALLAVGVVRRWRWTFWLILGAGGRVAAHRDADRKRPNLVAALSGPARPGPVQHRACHGGWLPTLQRLGSC
jgi:hypothetical protein